MGIIEKIKEIEAEMARTQKNKATGDCDDVIAVILFYYFSWQKEFLFSV